MQLEKTSALSSGLVPFPGGGDARRRRRTGRGLACSPRCLWLLLLAAVLLPAHAARAGLLDEVVSRWLTQKGQILSPSEWSRQPPASPGLVRRNASGRVTGVWGCFHWPQLHNPYYHSHKADITCGYIDIFPQVLPAGNPPSYPGAEWFCFLAPNVLVYTVPFNKGACLRGHISDFSWSKPFKPRCAQLDPMTHAMNDLYAIYGYSSTYSLNDVNALRPKSCLPPLGKVTLSPATIAKEQLAQLNTAIEDELEGIAVPQRRPGARERADSTCRRRQAAGQGRRPEAGLRGVR